MAQDYYHEQENSFVKDFMNKKGTFHGLPTYADAMKWIEEHPSDELIMRILNCIGYEEESWIEFVRKELKKKEITMTIEEEILAKIVARYERAKKEDGSKVTCMASRLSTPKERKERHNGFLAGLMTAEAICREVIKNHEL